MRPEDVTSEEEKTMNELERYTGKDDQKIATALVDAILAAHCTISVHDGEEWTVRRCEDRQTVLDALGSTGADTIRAVSPLSSENTASFYLVYGNGDASTICDYSDNTLAADILTKVNPVIERLEAAL
jgi:hypothetical protein